MEKMYAYAYNGSALAARRPFTEEAILKKVQDAPGHGADPAKFEIYELIPVTVTTKTVVCLERK